MNPTQEISAAQLQQLLVAYRQFVEQELFPIDLDVVKGPFKSYLPALKALREKAKSLGLFAPHLAKTDGGMGLNLVQFAQVSEILGQSPIGHYVFNCNAPDIGNMELLDQSGTEEQNAVKIFGDRKADHLILNAALFIKQEYSDRPVILVTKDVNLRLKARSLNLQAEDYETGKIQNLEGLYRGITQLDLEESEMIDKIHQMESVHYSEVMKSSPYNNHYFIYH